MTITTTDFADLLVIQPQVFQDNRGYFFESFTQKKWDNLELDYSWIQDNESKSSYGVIRGLHFQIGDSAQAKLVRVIQGKVLDVVVDLRQDQPTYGKSYSILLSGENKRQLLVPRGFAHGYGVLEDNTIFAYKCDNYYNKESESGIHCEDVSLEIDWLIPTEKRIISKKDQVLPLLKNL